MKTTGRLISLIIRGSLIVLIVTVAIDIGLIPLLATSVAAHSVPATPTQLALASPVASAIVPNTGLSAPTATPTPTTAPAASLATAIPSATPTSTPTVLPTATPTATPTTPPTPVPAATP